MCRFRYLYHSTEDIADLTVISKFVGGLEKEMKIVKGDGITIPF